MPFTPHAAASSSPNTPQCYFRLFLICHLLLILTPFAKGSKLDRTRFRSEFLDYDNFNSYKTDGSAYYKYLTSSFNSYFNKDNHSNEQKDAFKCQKDSDCSGDSTNTRCLDGECIRICHGFDCQYSHCSGKRSLVSTDVVENFIQTNNFPGLTRYLSNAKCSWILRNLNSGKFQDINRNIESQFPPFIQLEIERLSTEFGNDYMYIFDGDSIYSPLIAAFSGGSISSNDPALAFENDQTDSDTSKIQLNFYNTTSLFVLFKSDIFSVSEPTLDESKPSGALIKYRFSSSCTDRRIQNVQNTICYNSISNSKPTHQLNTFNQNTQTKLSRAIALNYFEPNKNAIPYIKLDQRTNMLNSKLRRAFHCSFVYKQFHYIVGGYSFQSDSVSFISRLDLDTLEWEYKLPERLRSNRQKYSSDVNFQPAESEPITPEARYAHTCVVDEEREQLFMFGGIKYSSDLNVRIDNHVTNELWSFNLLTNKWTLVNEEDYDAGHGLGDDTGAHNTKNYVLPIAVSGHSMSLVENGDKSMSLLIFFGFSEYYGSTLNVIQEFNLDTKAWRLHNTPDFKPNLGFSHTAIHDRTKHQILFYGGLSINNAHVHTNNNNDSNTGDINNNSFKFQTVDDLRRNFKAYLKDNVAFGSNKQSPNPDQSQNNKKSAKQNLLKFDPKPHMSSMLYKYDLNTRTWTELQRSRLATYMHSSALYRNRLLNFGGVTFNETGDALEISNQLRSYNIDGNEWTESDQTKKFPHRHRYAHSSFVYQDHLFIFAGFNGFFLEDLFKINLKQLFSGQQQHQKRQVIYPTDGNGPILLHEPLKQEKRQLPIKAASRSQNSQNKLFLGIIELCNVYNSCSSCHSNINCIWNRRKCEYFSASSLTTTHSSNSTANTVIYKKPSCDNICYEANTCTNCTASSECIWCSTSSRCVLRAAVMAYFPFGQCIEYTNQADQCETKIKKSVGHKMRQFSDMAPPLYSSCQYRYSNCSGCIMDERCGWCSADSSSGGLASNTGAGMCMEGAYSQANENRCKLNWYFTECPSCECNGHATCDQNTNVTNFEQVKPTCKECMNNTIGSGCGQCSSGYYGDPLNNGTCSSCECGKHSDICDNRQGNCYCNTKGVVGDRCDRCETPRYTGMPSLPDGTCYYNLSIDYQFTFNLNKASDRFYTKINFVNNIEDNTEDDIDFMIRCYKSEALFNVTFVVDYDPSTSMNGAKLEWPFNLFNNITNYIFYKNKTEYVLSISKSAQEQQKIDVLNENRRNNLEFYFGADKAKTLMLAQVNCSNGGFKYTFSNHEFKNKRNATFLVHVYDFAVPITVQISFSRRSPIQLLHFFFTFFGCLFSLLAIAFVTWKSKQRYDQYRHQRQLVIQMEHMASRPFTKLLLDVSKAAPNTDRPDADMVNSSASMEKNGKPPTTPLVAGASKEDSGGKKNVRSKFCGRLSKRANKKLNKSNEYLEKTDASEQIKTESELINVMPIAVEPLNNNKTAVLTCILKLPQGGLSHTPKGSSPIVLASTYVHCNSSTSFNKSQDSNNDSIMLDDEEENARNKSENV